MISLPRFLFFAIFLMAGSAILYELLLAAVLSYLLGATVLYFSVTIGIFLFALGVGAWFSRRLEADLLKKFLTIEAVLAILGGFAVPLMFGAYALLFRYLGSHTFNNLFSFLFQVGIAEILFNGISFLLIFAIGVLVGVELPLFTRLVSQSLRLKEALARVFFWDYAGSLAGSVLFPLLLLPTLGFLRTGFLVGLLNGVGAVILAASIGQRPVMKNFSLAGKAALGIGSLALITGFILAPQLERVFTRMIFADSKVLWDETSPYQRIQLVENHGGKIALFLNAELQFQSGLLEERYHETFARPVMAFMGERARRILVLGGGDGLLLRELWKYPQVESVTMVDIDPAVTRLAATHPVMRGINRDSFRDPRLTLVHDDAFRWLLQRRGEPFDTVFIDLPDPTDDALRRLYSKEFYLLVRRNLAPDGIAITQAGSLPSRFHGVAKKTLAASGYYTLSLHPPGLDPIFGIQGIFESSFVVASPQPHAADTLLQVLQNNVALGGNSREFVTPYLTSRSLAEAPRHSLFHPIRSYGVGGSLTQRAIASQVTHGTLAYNIGAVNASTQIINLVTGRGPFTPRH
ncbi:MAG: hypothetical protein Q8R35_01425 [bacterium]|nr:hypothetical protein [bacterium]